MRRSTFHWIFKDLRKLRTDLGPLLVVLCALVLGCGEGFEGPGVTPVGAWVQPEGRGPEPSAFLAPTGQANGEPEVRLLAILSDTSATPLYPGAEVLKWQWSGPLTVFARVSEVSTVQEVEFWFGPRKTVLPPPSSSLLSFEWNPSVMNPEVFTLRLVARDTSSAQEAEDQVDVLVVPRSASVDFVSRTDWRIEMDGPDSWSDACEEVRVRARLVQTEQRHPFERLAEAQWTVFLDDKPVASSGGQDLDVTVDLASVPPGPRSLRVQAGLRTHNDLTGEEVTWSLAREVVVAVSNQKGCQPVPCFVRVVGIGDGEVLSALPGIVFADVDPDLPGAEVDFVLDGSLFWTDAAPPRVAPFPFEGLEDGAHVLAVRARLPDGWVCEDLVRFTRDTTAPALSVEVEDLTECWARLAVRVSDTTAVQLGPIPSMESALVDEGGGLIWSVSVLAGHPFTVHAEDALGHVSEVSGDAPRDDEPAKDLRLSLPARIFGTWFVGIEWKDCAPPESLEVTALVDGKPAADSGLVFPGIEGVLGPPGVGSRWLLGEWDTSQVSDGVHEVLVQVRVDGVFLEAQTEVTTLDATLTGQEVWLSACDPEFLSCGPVRTTRASGPVGLVAEVPWYAPDLPAPRITIRADGELVAQCVDRRCEWVLDFEALGRQEVHVSAEAKFEALGVRLGASETWTLVEHDLDGDGFAAQADGGDDCDDQDPFIHPGRPDPEGPECTRAGPPLVTPILQAPGLAMSLYRDPQGRLDLVHCDPASHAFWWLTMDDSGTRVRLLEGGVPSCEAASSQMAVGPGGTLWALMREPGADPEVLVGRLDRDPPEVQGLPVRLDKVADAALVVPADDAPAVLITTWKDLLVFSHDGGTWTARPLGTYSGWPLWTKEVASVVGAVFPTLAAVQVCKGPLELWAIGPDGSAEARPVPWDLHDHAVVERHDDRLPFLPYEFQFSDNPIFSEWSLRGVAKGRVGDVFVLLVRTSESGARALPYLVRVTENAVRTWFLHTDLPDESGRPLWSLDGTRSVSLGAGASGAPLVAWVREPYANRAIPWQLVGDLAEGFPPTLTAVRWVGQDPVPLAVPEGQVFEAAWVVPGGAGAGEVAVRMGQEVLLLSWPCEEWRHDDTDCDGNP